MSQPNVKSNNYAFISYSRTDKAFVNRLVSDIGERVILWRDTDKIKLGTSNWETEIRKAIRGCYAILLIASPSSLKSLQVQGELAVAKRNKRPIIAIWAKGRSWIDCVPMSMSKHQYIDLRSNFYTNDALEEIVAALGSAQLEIAKEPIGKEDEAAGIEAPISLLWSATFFPTIDLSGTGIQISHITDLNFNWGTGVPVIHGVNVPGIGADNFSARFTATATIPKGKYEFVVVAKDGVRVYVDGTLVSDHFIGREFTQDPPITLSAGVHNFSVEYFHGIDQAIIQVAVTKVKTARR